MTTWHPADGEHEVLSFGSERPPVRTPRLLLGVGGACLAAGFVVGLLVGTEVSPTAPAAAPEPAPASPAATRATVPVAAGTVTKSAAEEDGFTLSVFNWSAERIRAGVVALPGWLPILTDRDVTTIPPRAWGVLTFSAPVDSCRGEPGPVRSAVLFVESGGVTDSRLVPLAEPAHIALGEHYEAACSGAVRQTP